MPCYRRGSRSTGKLGGPPESHSADGQSPSRPGVGPLGHLWSPSPGEQGRGEGLHMLLLLARCPSQVEHSPQNRVMGVPEHSILLTSDVAKSPFAVHECPCFPRYSPVLPSWDFLPREGVISFSAHFVLWACMSSLLPFDLFPLLCTHSVC